MRALVGVVLAIATSGCNGFAVFQGGPVVVSEGPAGGPVVPKDGAANVGGQLEMSAYLDINAATEYLNKERPPEVASRFGPNASLWTRASGQGFGIGERVGAFAGYTERSTTVMASLGVPFGLDTAHGTAYFTYGVTASLLGGIAVHQEYAERSIFLCRELTYVTLNVQGTLDKLPAANVDVPSIALLIGIMHLDDAGIPSDEKPSGGRCPSY